MQQVSQYLSGQRDYTLLKGDTGPLVYPAAHVYIYSALYYLTDEGHDIARAQWIFTAVYLASLSVVMGCYRLVKVGRESSLRSFCLLSFGELGGLITLAWIGSAVSLPTAYPVKTAA